MDNRLVDLFWNDVYRMNDRDCWEWLGYIENRGYGVLVYKFERYKAHRLSWMIHYGSIPEDKIVMHICDNRKCVNPIHLKLGTQDDNMKDCKTKQRNVKHTGEDHGMALLSESQVINILSELKQGVKSKDLAHKYRVHRGTIDAIKLNKSWKHIKR